MLSKYKIPKTLIWCVQLMAGLFIMFTVFRLITFLAFRPPGFSFSDCLPAFLMGVQYDLRWIAILILPIVLLGIYRPLSPFYSEKNKRWWTLYMSAIIFIVFFLFIADIVSFSYNSTRLDAGAMNFVEDPGISLNMIWQTYPLIWITLGLFCALITFRWILGKSHWRVINVTEGKAIPHRKGPFIIAALVLGFFVYGKADLHSLKWKDAFALKDGFKTYLALNPFQNFSSTMRLREPVFNEPQARKVFPVMEDFLQLPKENNFNFNRTVAPRSNALESKPNIVLVMCESFSMYKSTMGGNPLNTTPYFDSLTKKGIFFEKCFSPHFSTARGLFAIVTGIPDVQMFKFSTRNPAAIDQRTIINELDDYKKFYFLGGNPEFNNFEGLLNNIQHLDIYTEANIKAPKVNVWGVSDKDLFLTANNVFKQQKAPFFAIVQTSGNHRPYTIPETDTDFTVEHMEQDTLEKYGFGSAEEYNAFRYADYSFRQFIEAAQQQDYFHNTIFVFVGDHGVAGNATAMYPSAWTNERLSDVHVPLLFYAPHLIEPGLHKEVVSQIDVLPTIAGFLQRPYVNTTLGRDLLDPHKKQDMAFVTNTAGKIGVVTNDFYYVRSLDFPEEEMVPVTHHPPAYTTQQLDSIQKQLALFTNAYYQTALYMLLNNKK